MSRLDQIDGPANICRISAAEWEVLASEIRRFLISHCAESGGHLASNLGVVELTMAMYLSFCPPEDKIIWDVGHQPYTHKILGGHKKDFAGLRQFGGIAGFPKRNENPCGASNIGHSSTSISTGLGTATARDLRGEHHAVISVIGDDALTGGMAYEALNNAGRMKSNFIIVLDDNRTSISENVGGISACLNSIRTSAGYSRLKENVAEVLPAVPGFGKHMVESLRTTRNGIKQLFVPGMLFENLGVIYLGSVDGHDIKKMIRVFKEARRLNRVVLVHVITEKGKGYRPAEQYPDLFHGVGPSELATGVPKKNKHYPDYADVFSKTLIQLAAEDSRIITVTAAMPEGTGLAAFGRRYPQRYFGVGTAEQHAVTSAADLAAGGMKPVVAVYSSFLQRGFSQVLHDACIQNLPMISAIDRAGLVDADDETHQGVFDLSYLGRIPNMTILAPKNCWELEEELRPTSSYGGPIAIRYPYGQTYHGLGEHRESIRFGKVESLFRGEKAALPALGSMVSTAEHAREKLKAFGQSCTLVNMRFAKPTDRELLAELAETHQNFVALEENVLHGGFGLEVAEWASSQEKELSMMHVALPDAYVEHGDVSVLRQHLGIDSDSIIRVLQDKYHW